MKINKNNFFKNTFGIFVEKQNDIIETLGKPDYISYCKSFDPYTYEVKKTDCVSSKYWYTSKGVYRLSDHWGATASCYWQLLRYFIDVDDSDNDKDSETVLAFCKWNDFKTITTYAITKEIYEHYEGEYPLLPENLIGKNNLCYEFKGLYLCDFEDIKYPICRHPNHRASTIALVDDFFREELNIIIENYNCSIES